MADSVLLLNFPVLFHNVITSAKSVHLFHYPNQKVLMFSFSIKSTNT